jgi:ankyrin repeat protein
MRYNYYLLSQDTYGMTPLHKAMRPTLRSVEEEVEVVRLLIDAGAKVGAVSYTQATPGTLVDGYTPLHCAAVHGDCAVARMRLLVQHGADVNARTSLCGCTALHMAACLGREKAVSLLLVELGVDANIKCKSGNTARDLASNSGFHGIVKTLDTHLRVRNPLHRQGLELAAKASFQITLLFL